MGTVMEITNERILEKEGDQKVSQLHNEQLRLVGENEANIKAYAIEKEAEANRKLLTAEYVKLNMAKAISPNTKYYFSGEKGIVSGLLSKILDSTIMCLKDKHLSVLKKPLVSPFFVLSILRNR